MCLQYIYSSVAPNKYTQKMNVGVLNNKIEPNGVHFKERKHKHTIKHVV